MAIVKLQPVPAGEPIIGPSLGALSLAPNPTGQQLFLTGVAVQIAGIAVEKSVAQSASRGQIRVHPFKAQVELGYARHVRKEKTAANGRTVPVGDGRNLVVGKGVTVKRHPIPELWHAIGPVHS